MPPGYCAMVLRATRKSLKRLANEIASALGQEKLKLADIRCRYDCSRTGAS